LFSISELLLSLQEKNVEVVIGLFLLASILAFLTYRRTFPALAKRRRALLLSLRILALFCLFLVLSEPILSIASKRTHRPVVGLLLDNSRSMSLRVADAERAEELKSLLQSEVFDHISSAAELTTFAFTDSLIPLASRDQLPDSMGSATAIGEAIKAMTKQLEDQNLVGVVILSDGANNLGEDPVLAARSAGVPIYTGGVGEYVAPRDLSIDRIVYTDVGYVGDEMPVEIDVSQTGFDQLTLPVSIKEKKAAVVQQNLTLGKSGATRSIKLSITPEEAGLHQYRLSIPVQGQEAVKENNQRTFAIKVLKSKIKTLLISGSLNWEYTFLRRALEADRNVELETVVYGKARQPVVGRFPQGEEQLASFDILLLVDPPRFVLADHKRKIEDFVLASGGSALLLLGKQFMDTYGFMEISNLLPFDPSGIWS
jgi:hypothetical protein